MIPEPTSIQVTGPVAGEAVNVLGASVVIKSGVAAQGLFFADHPVPPGYFVPMHVHQDEDELFYVLEGVFRGLHAAAHNGLPGPDRVGEICAANGVRLL